MTKSSTTSKLKVASSSSNSANEIKKRKGLEPKKPCLISIPITAPVTVQETIVETTRRMVTRLVEDTDKDL